MRLKKLELQGFKSFGKKTVLHFSQGVTGIVGPNGSGKSNVVDAIRWVLGEQKSRDLRLDKMSDVLFNGTKTKKRTGLAQVTITFENDKGLLPIEYQEVAISRLLYRSGESAYKLNGITCRRKDIQTLLANTGIGSNTYAIIQLGMVDDILRDKQNARRRMFEQSAGIYGFKKRKHETELKLKATQEDLDRVEDLLHEIRNNLKQLERQAKRAKRYLKLKEQYREASILLAAYRVSAYTATYAELKEKIENMQEQLTEVTANINTSKAEVQERRTELDRHQRQLTERQQLVRAAENDRMRINNEIDLLTRDISHLQENIKQSKESSQTSATRLDHLLAQIQELEVKVKDEQDKHSASSDEVTRARADRDELYERSKFSEKGKDDLVRQIQEISQGIAEHERVSAVQQNRLSSLDDESRHLERERQEQANRASAWTEEQGSLDAKIAEQKKNIEECEAALDNFESKRDQLKEQIEVAEQQKQDIQRTIEVKRNEHELLSNMIDNLEGYPESIKFLAKEYSWEGRAALLSEVFICEPEYRNAMEAILEPYLNCYIVPHAAEALRAVKVLREAQKGKATFLVSQASDVVKQDAAEPAGFSRAIDLVQVDEAYQPLFHHLLFNICIQVDSNADMPLVLPQDSMTLVDQQGLLVHSSRLISGGSSGLFDGMKIGRRKQVEAIQEEIDTLENQLVVRSNALITLKDALAKIDIRQHRQTVEHARRVLIGLEKDKLTIVKRVEEQSLADEKLKTRLSDNQQQRSEAQRRADEAASAIPPLLEARKTCEEKLASESTEIHALNEALTKANERFAQVNLAHVQQQARIEQLQQQSKMVTERVSELRQEQDRAGRTLDTSNTSLEAKRQALDKAKTDLQECKMAHDKLHEAYQIEEEQYVELKNILLSQEHELTKQNSLYQRTLQQMEATKDAYNEVRIQLNDVTQRVKVEFDVINEDLVKMELPDDYQGDEATASVEKLRTKVHQFGEVNPMAVEAFNEMKARHDHIDGQRQDIIDARDSLRKTIKELDEEATKQFLEAFEKIKQYFQQIFRTLFNPEDTCDLVLVDEDHPLESAIDIIAKPKGKRPVSLSQLSGGETTLTATALLFALYLLKPAPFCIFDEVDAPLDDMNIQKFNDIIKEFSGDSQFIIITHNKLTMAAVDVIYGVFMDEPGISSTAAVDFRSLVEEPTGV